MSALFLTRCANLNAEFRLAYQHLQKSHQFFWYVASGLAAYVCAFFNALRVLNAEFRFAYPHLQKSHEQLFGMSSDLWFMHLQITVSFTFVFLICVRSHFVQTYFLLQSINA